MSPIPYALVDYDCKLERGLLLDLAEMLTVVSQRDFAKAEPGGYGVGAICRVAQTLTDVGPGEQLMGFWSRPDVPGALGYHDVDKNGKQISHIFPFLDDPANEGVTASHELFEALANPGLNTCVVGPDGRVRAREPGDPVEAFSYPYKCASGRILQVSNWVTPAYFNPPAVSDGTPYDFMGKVKYPGEILSGGYQIYWDNGQWISDMPQRKRPYRFAMDLLRETKVAKLNRMGIKP